MRPFSKKPVDLDKSNPYVKLAQRSKILSNNSGNAITKPKTNDVHAYNSLKHEMKQAKKQDISSKESQYLKRIAESGGQMTMKHRDVKMTS